MNSEIQQKTKSRAYRVAVGSIISTMITLGCYASVPLFLVPLSETLGVTIGKVSLLFTFASIGSLIVSLTFGSLLKALKPRPLVCLAGVAIALFYIGIFMAKSIVTVYIGAFIFGLGTPISGYVIAQTEITWWFAKNRGKIMSLLNVGVGVIALILSPVIASLMEIHGVRTVALVQGVVAGVLIIVNALILLADPPEKYGMKPYGYEDSVVTDSLNTTASDVEGKGLSLKQIMTTVPFWMVFLAVVLINAALTGFTNNASAFYQSIGLSSMNAALCISVYSACKLVWSPIYGTLTDKKGPRFATAVFCSIGAVTLVIGTFLSGFGGAAIIAVMIGSISFGGMLGAVSYPRIYGTKEAANLVGISNAAGSIGAMVGAPIAGFIYDTTSSYSLYLIIAALMLVICILFIMTAMSKKAVEKMEALI